MLKDAFYRKFKYTIPLLFIVMMLGILSGCNNDENVNASENDFKINEIDNGVSTEYRNFIIVSADAYTTFLRDEKEGENVEHVKELALDYLTFVSKNRVQPSSSVEFDIDEYFHKFLISSKYTSEYYIKYVNSNDKTSYSIFKDYKKDSLSDFEVAANIAQSYGIE